MGDKESLSATQKRKTNASALPNGCLYRSVTTGRVRLTGVDAFPNTELAVEIAASAASPTHGVPRRYRFRKVHHPIMSSTLPLVATERHIAGWSVAGM
jgi:hypothetical protein